MVTKIKKGTSSEEIKTLFEKLQEKRKSRLGFDAFKYCGKVKFEVEAIEFQKRMRDEWE